MARPLKVMTYNMANYDDHLHWPTRADMFSQVIMSTQPDIILFQEVRFNPDEIDTKANYQNMAEEVLAILQQKNQYRGAYHVHVPVERIPLAPDDAGYTVPSPASLSPLHRSMEWEGLSIISRLFIKETGTVWLTPPNKMGGDLNTRATQYAAIDLSDGNGTENLIYVFNTHFAYVVPDAMQNVSDTMSYIRRFKDISKGYYLLAGDFNMEPGSAPINLLDESDDFIDLWPHLWGTQQGYTFPSTKPIKRIDYIYVSPTLLNLAQSIYVCGNIPDPLNIYTSDHLGLITTFNINVDSKFVVDSDELIDGFVLV